MSHGPAPLQLLTRAGCHLCEEARDIVAALAQRYAVAWAEVDIATDARLAGTYADRVPVTLLDGVEQGCWWVDEEQLGRALARRTGRAPAGGAGGAHL